MPQLPTDEQALENLRQARRRVDRSQDFFIGLYQTPWPMPLAPWLIRRHVRPNTVTVWMILSGILAAGLIALPSRIALILGAAVIQLFMLFDYADGAVARATGRCRPMGGELDSLAHLIGHPLMMVAFTLALVRLGEAPTLWTVALGGVYGMLEMCSRTLVEMDAVVALRAGAADALACEALEPQMVGQVHRRLLHHFPELCDGVSLGAGGGRFCGHPCGDRVHGAGRGVTA